MSKYILKENYSKTGKVTLSASEYKLLAENLKAYYRRMTDDELDAEREYEFIGKTDSSEQEYLSGN